MPGAPPWQPPYTQKMNPERYLSLSYPGVVWLYPALPYMGKSKDSKRGVRVTRYACQTSAKAGADFRQQMHSHHRGPRRPR
jgi:DhnA family fructose-bisphosphate aldolase class Ia